MPDNCVNNFIFERQWVRIFLCYRVELLEINIVPFFLGTTIIGDNQVASSIGSIKPIASNLSMSCFTIIA
jgi:hypothetical protein